VAGLVDAESRLNRIQGDKYMPQLVAALDGLVTPGTLDAQRKRAGQFNPGVTTEFQLRADILVTSRSHAGAWQRDSITFYRNGKMRFISLLTVSIIATILVIGIIFMAAEAPTIRLNTIGYLPDSEKKATIAAECSQFLVVSAKDNARVFQGVVTGPALNEDTGEQLYTADFSAVTEPGEYLLDVPGVGKSAPFHIAADVFNRPFYTVMRGFYLWRCGTAVEATYNGKTFGHGPCHMEDAWLDAVTGQHQRRDGTKGWHDAGDYNKYTVNAGVTVGMLFRAWEDFGAKIQRIRLDIPESGGQLPDFLAELKWELDWLLTMQASDGSVYHKITTRQFGGFVPPEQETEPRYFTPWGSAATADFTAMTATAARSFRPYDPEFADRCLVAARKSYEFLQANPQNHAPDMKGFNTGPYDTGDADDRLWAAAELWETTGDTDVLADLEARIKSAHAELDVNWDWEEVSNLGLLTYLFSKQPGRDMALVAQVRDNLLANADAIVRTRNAHGYARPLGTSYYWGCNGGVARQTINLCAAYRVSPKPEYRETALDAVNHLFGRNCYGRSLVTGLGDLPPMHPHDRRSGGDKVDDPWPGYLVGGPHPKATDWQDIQDDFRTNEIAINWNAALVYALAAFLDDPELAPRLMVVARAGRR
jgi:endoglucanase